MGADKSHPEYTNDKWLGDSDNPKPQSSAENYGDPSGKLWSMYLTEAAKEDDQMTKNWTKDTQGVLTFTGLFSSIIATFIAISLPQLSADSSAPTVLLLSQLVNITAETAGVSVTVPPITPFKAPAAIVRVNVMWCLSLILSLSCALLATLMQQWARRYMVYAQHGSAPRKQARIRAYMFEGVMNFRMSQAVEAMPLLLHTSVFLFFAGLIEFLFTINNAVARYTLGCVVFFASIYAILTLLPHWRLNCPYRTPLSWFTYYSFHLSVSSLLSVVKAIEDGCHPLLLELWRWTRLPRSQDHGPTKWANVLEKKAQIYYDRLSHSLRWRVVFGAMGAPPSVDIGALHWTLTTLGENQKIEDFAANMPGFFNSTETPDTPDATSAMLSLMSEQPTFDPILGSRLQELLNTCLPGTSFLTEEQRKSRLRVCLTSLWHCLRAFNLPKNLEMPLASYVRAVFASPDVIRWIQTEKDFAVRLLGRCFGSLVVKKLASDIASAARTPTVAEIACFKTILNATGDQVWAWLDLKGAIDLANVTLLASAELETLVVDGTRGVPADVGDVFQQTLGILGEGMFSSEAKVEWDTSQVAQFHKIYSKLINAPVPEVLTKRLRYISERLPQISYLEEPEMVMPIPEPVSETTLSSPGPPQISYPTLTVRDSGFGDVVP
jgi:hypothetical protein